MKTGYSLSRLWFNFAFEKRECKAIHTAIYMWLIELNNRLGWKKEFALPAADTMEGLSIGNKHTYLAALRNLKEWGFIEIISESKNQYQACIIQICHVRKDTAPHSALDTALTQHGTQHSNSTIHGNGISTDTIDKPVNKQTIKPTNKETIPETKVSGESAVILEPEILIYPTFEDFWDCYDKKISRPKCEKAWNKLNQTEKEGIMNYLFVYIKATPDKKFRKNPLTFFNNKSWNDEIINHTKQPEPDYTAALIRGNV